MNEVDVCYLNDNGVFQSRKTERYDTFDKAVEVFVKTVKKFQSSHKHALITLRTLENKQWTLQKAERT